MGDTAAATKARKKKQDELDKIKPVMSVKNTRDAKSERVLSYCIKELSSGTTWSELRRMLGLGHASIDPRWRTIRETLTKQILPANEEEALQAQMNMSEMVLSKLEEFQDYLDERIERTKGEDNEHHMLKLKLDSMKLAFERYEKRVEQFLTMKKIQKDDQKSRGPSIIYQNINYIPRPGDGEREVKDVTQKVTKIIGDGKE